MTYKIVYSIINYYVKISNTYLSYSLWTTQHLSHIKLHILLKTSHFNLYIYYKNILLYV